MQRALISLCVAGTVFSYPAVAEQPSHNWIGAFVEHYEVDSDKPLDNSNMDDGANLGGEVGIGLNQDWSFRLEYARMQLDHETNPAIDLSGKRLGIDALYFLDDPDIYTFVGYKVEDLEQTYRMANLGVGKHWQLSKNWRLISEAAIYHDFGQSFNDFGIKLGIAYTFGNTGSSYQSPEPTQAAAPPTQPEPEAVRSDSDKDGVYDAQDQCPNTPTQDKVDSKGCSIFVDESVTQNLEVLFANDSAEVENPEAEKFHEFQAFLQRFPNTSAQIQGHTSTVGDADYNQALSERRARAVRQLLIDRYNIAPERLSAVGYGESRPLNPANTAEAHKQNRRIEASVTATEKKKLTR
ncbi:Outer membrane porin [Saliniradius amylolyticus]|uniref:Outer membrane porin n=1 Tax=Saliniradius amylolyticus TaxID=2183582 RepID=A0A2S2E6B6_9ALTE|nr:OmpA family protein [Saliniradius amylolyticus]AWL12507.1 Outer membrane porin [Saliniradius amylolyticus]